VIGEKAWEQHDAKRGIEAHEHDLIHDLGRRLCCQWEYDRCMVNAEGVPELHAFWRGMKSHEQRNIDQLKRLMAQ
jgi:hypothetical protein